MERSRTINSLKNLFSGVLSKVLMFAMSFITRTAFVYCLSVEYLGINGLFSNILTVLSLAELGFGTAVVYSLYSPLANNDEKKVTQILKLYRIVYYLIGSVVLLVGLGLLPWLDYLIASKPNIDNLYFIYSLFVLNSSISYFTGAYKKSILIADQKQYIINYYSYLFNMIKSIAQIIILFTFKEFVLYLLLQIIFTICENIYISYYVNLKYSFLKEMKKQKIDGKDKKRIFSDVYALFFTKLGHIMLNGTDNLIIAKFVGLVEVGILSNYMLIVDSISALVLQLCSSLSASIGNYIATHNKLDSLQLFKKIDFLNYWIFSSITICMFILFNPFIEIWLGNNYIFDKNIVFIISLNFFIHGIISVLWTFRSTMGLFVQGKYRSLFVGIINIVLSLMLSKIFGVFGVLFATTISRVAITLWYDPYIIYKYGFHSNVIDYYVLYLKRFKDFALILLISSCINYYVTISNFFEFVAYGMVLYFVINIVYVILYHDTKEYQYYYDIVVKLCDKIVNKNN